MNIFLIFFPRKQVDIPCKFVSSGDNLHEMSKPVFLGKYKIYFNVSAENFTKKCCVNFVCSTTSLFVHVHTFKCLPKDDSMLYEDKQ